MGNTASVGRGRCAGDQVTGHVTSRDVSRDLSQPVRASRFQLHLMPVVLALTIDQVRVRGFVWFWNVLDFGCFWFYQEIHDLRENDGDSSYLAQIVLY